MVLKPNFRVVVSSLLLTVFLVSFAVPVCAFEGREGDSILVSASETINDNLYVGAQTFTMDGTVIGDVFAGGKTITINGKVDGDVMAAGQTVIINGTVTGDVRMAGGALYIGDKASVTGDVLAFGASFETRKGSQTGLDLVFFGGQALLAGDVKRNIKAAAGGLEINGAVGGNLEAEVGDSSQAGPDPSIYLPQVSIAIPKVQTGLKIAPEARVGGNLIYTSSKELSFPANVAAGGIQHRQPVIKPEDIVKTPTLAEQIATGTFNVLRRMITLILFGLFLLWLFPAFLKKTGSTVQNAAFPMLGWGIVACAAFLFAGLVLTIATIVGAVIFGILTLNSISGVIVWIGILALFALTVGFVLVSAHLAQIIVSLLGGKLILARIKPEWSEHKTWPLIIGVVIFALVSAIPVLGWLVNFLAVLLGLGALWTLGREALKKQQQPAI